MPVTRSMALADPGDFETVELCDLLTAADAPGEPSHHLCWYFEGGYVAVVPVRRALDPDVVLLAVPSEVLAAETLPQSPSGYPPRADVMSNASRAKVRVSFLAVAAADLEEGLATSEMCERHGFEVRAFGPQGNLVPRSRDLVQAALDLGFDHRDDAPTQDARRDA